MDIFICIDDTDTINTPGTGHLSQAIEETIEEKGWGKCSGITRHLPLGSFDDVAYRTILFHLKPAAYLL